MARGVKKVDSSPVSKGANWTTFVEISLAGHTMSQIRDEYPTVESVYDKFNGFIGEGYRVSFSYNEQNDAVIVSVTCKVLASPNAGCTYTSFAGDWFFALQIALYKHYVVTKGDWSAAAAANSRPAFG